MRLPRRSSIRWMSGVTTMRCVGAALLFAIATTSGFCACTLSTASAAPVEKSISPAMSAAIAVGVPEISVRSTSSPCCCQNPLSFASQKGATLPDTTVCATRTRVGATWIALLASPPAADAAVGVAAALGALAGPLPDWLPPAAGALPRGSLGAAAPARRREQQHRHQPRQRSSHPVPPVSSAHARRLLREVALALQVFQHAVVVHPVKL